MTPTTRQQVVQTLRSAAEALSGSTSVSAGDPTADAILKKVAKKTKIGVYDPVQVVDALNVADPGWTIEETTTTMQASSYSNQHDRFQHLWADRLGIPSEASMYDRKFKDVPAGVKPVNVAADHFYIQFEENQGLAPGLKPMDVVKEVLSKMEKPLIKGKTLPARPEVDGLYVAGLKVEDVWRGGDAYMVTVQKARLGVPGFLITSPAGSKLELPVQPKNASKPGNPKELSAASLWTWLYKETDAPAKAQAYLENPDTQARHGVQKRAKDIEKAGGAGVVGTCAICDRLQKMERKRTHSGHPIMVHHGYRRPGVGWIVGDCFGVGYPPYELSAIACVELAKYMTERIAGQKEAIEAIRARTQLEIWIGVAPNKWATHSVNEYRLVVLHKDGRVEEKGQTIDREKFRRMKKGVTESMSREEMLKFHDEFLKQEGQFTPSMIVTEDELQKPASIFKADQAKDLKEAAARLTQMESYKAEMEKRARDWIAKPLPGTT